MVHLSYKVTIREVKCRQKAVFFIKNVTFKVMEIPFSVFYIFQHLIEFDVTFWKAVLFLILIYIYNLDVKRIFVILTCCKRNLITFGPSAYDRQYTVNINRLIIKPVTPYIEIEQQMH
jgi:hypothetical protein